MRYLLDTHAFLWWLADDPRLSNAARAIMAGGGNDLLWSAASSWEVAIKFSIGKISLPLPPSTYLPAKLREQRILSLAVDQAHALRVAVLPPLHRDPFDRLLVAQALVEGLPILTSDRRLADYGVDVVW